MRESLPIHIELESTLLCRLLDEILQSPDLSISQAERNMIEEQLLYIKNGGEHGVVHMGNMISILDVGFLEWVPYKESDTEGVWMWAARESTDEVFMGPDTEDPNGTFSRPTQTKPKKALHLRAFEIVLNWFKKLQSWQETVD